MTTRAPRMKFGQIAIMLGFVDEEQLDEALRVQRETSARGGRHKLLGLVMLELGMIDNAALIEILKRYEELESSVDETL
ncbi:MAG: hypothetical protein D6776_05065 [Planctomycetota bacterium]|nr:MAG: hypothetical protein D6776_05065 [Planctomycetota bacterium]